MKKFLGASEFARVVLIIASLLVFVFSCLVVLRFFAHGLYRPLADDYHLHPNYWQFVVQVSGVVASIVFGLVVVLQTMVAQGALKEASEQRMQGERPLVIPSDGPIPAEFVQHGVGRKIAADGLMLKNIGHGPALDVELAVLDLRTGHLYGAKLGLLTSSGTLLAPWGPAYSGAGSGTDVLFEAQYCDLFGRVHRTAAVWNHESMEWRHINFDVDSQQGLIKMFNRSELNLLPGRVP